MEQFFVLLKTISFLSFKQMFDGDTALDGKPIDFKVFAKFFRFIYFLLKVNFIKTSLLFFN